MHAVYCKRLLLSEIVISQLYLWTPKITEYVKNDHCICTKWQHFMSRHVLLNGPKVQDANCTKTFLKATETRH